ncbi:MAG: hypothetical protein ACHQAY_18690 [Hyphomicrobiales bacterium]
MDKESVVARLRGTGFQVRKIAPMGDEVGWRFLLTNGAVIRCFDDGRCIVHGPSAASLRFILRRGAFGNSAWAAASPQQSYYLF